MKPSRSSLRFATIILGLVVFSVLPERVASASMIKIVPSSPTWFTESSETTRVLIPPTTRFSFAAADIKIAFDPARFALSNGSMGLLDSGPGFTIVPGESSTGLVQASTVANSPRAPLTCTTVCAFETFTFTALATAPGRGNEGEINRDQNDDRTNSAFFSDPTTATQIVLTTYPANGYDNSLDGSIIVGAVFLEPSFLILVLIGLGSGAVVLTTLFRKKNRSSKVG